MVSYELIETLPFYQVSSFRGKGTGSTVISSDNCMPNSVQSVATLGVYTEETDGPAELVLTGRLKNSEYLNSLNTQLG